MIARSLNPFSNLLSASHCLFDVKCDQLNDVIQSLSKLQSVDSSAFYRMTSNGTIRFSIPHSSIDAFGCLYQLKQLLSKSVATQSNQKMTSDESCDLYFYHCRSERRFTDKADRTYSQCLTENIIKSFQLSSEQLAIIVALDDLMDLDQECVKGNSFSIVQASAPRFKTLANENKNEWKSFLLKRAHRAFELATLRLPKQSDNLQRSEPHIVISSLGDLKRFPWAIDIVPGFAMYPTPISPNSANIASWSFDKDHYISIAIPKSHTGQEFISQFEENWRNQFNDK